MNLLTNSNAEMLWQDVIKHAEESCSVTLDKGLENYLVSLLIQYTTKPELVKQVFAKAFLEAQQLRAEARGTVMREVGDQCLLFAGLFPQSAEKKLVKIGYFVDLGRAAYISLSYHTNDLFGSLALQFVVLMDVLQSIRQFPDLLPLQAYEQWNEVGSQHALKILQFYTDRIPLKNYSR